MRLPGIVQSVALFCATGAYTGYFPVAPGTVGSAVGLALFVGVRSFASPVLEGLTLVIVFAIGCWAGSAAERHFGMEDPSPVVIDEVLGMLLTLAFLPVTMTGALVAFFVFRVLDVVKPFPARRLEHLPGGLGIMSDDAMVAVYGNLLLRAMSATMPGLLLHP